MGIRDANDEPGLSVRQASPAQAAAIHHLMHEAFTAFRPLYTAGCFDATVLDEVRIAQRMAQGPVWVVEGDGLLGTLSAVPDDRGLYLRGMGVHPEARRQGVGRLLLETAEAHAKTEGFECMWLSTTPFLQASIALYRQFGFREGPGPSALHGTPLVSFTKSLG